MALLEGVKHGKFPLYTVPGFVLEMFFEIYIPWLQDGILRNRDQRKLRSEKVDHDKAPAVDGSDTKGKGNKRKKTDRKDKSKKHSSNKSKNDGSKKKPQQNTTKPAKKKADPKAENGVSEPRGKKKPQLVSMEDQKALKEILGFKNICASFLKVLGKF